jgi:hypothetical protein
LYDGADIKFIFIDTFEDPAKVLGFSILINGVQVFNGLLSDLTYENGLMFGFDASADENVNIGILDLKSTTMSRNVSPEQIKSVKLRINTATTTATLTDVIIAEYGEIK